jgi:hypothetical protein
LPSSPDVETSRVVRRRFWAGLLAQILVRQVLACEGPTLPSPTFSITENLGVAVCCFDVAGGLANRTGVVPGRLGPSRALPVDRARRLALCNPCLDGGTYDGRRNG